METENSICSLLEPCKRGERRAQQALYSLLAPRMYGLCMRYAKEEDDAQEILQKGFIKVFKNLSSFRGEGSFEGWVRRIMVHVAIEQYHQKKEKQILLDLDGIEELAGNSFEMHALEAQDLLRLIQDLPEGFRLVFNMYAIEGYSHKEIAAELNISEGTSKSQLSRARTWLKNKINILEGDMHGING